MKTAEYLKGFLTSIDREGGKRDCPDALNQCYVKIIAFEICADLFKISYQVNITKKKKRKQC